MASVNAKAGWFSRRHQTNEAFLAYQAEKEGRVQQQQRDCQARIEAAKNRTPEEQVARLDKMFGKGQGAKKERAKLALRIEAKQDKAHEAEVKAQRAANKPKKKSKKRG